MSTESLDFSPVEFRELLKQTNELIIEQHKNLDVKKIYHDHTAKEVASWFDESLPEEGISKEQLLAEVKTKVLDTATGNIGPHMYAYVVSGGNQIAVVAEQLAATINQNVGKWHLSPAISEIEQRVCQWAADMMGLGRKMGGVVVSGGSEANLAGLTVARNIFFERHSIRKKGLFGMKPFTVYAGEQVHGCVDKSMELLGIGTDQLRRTLSNADYTVNLEKLEEQIKIDIEAGFLPFCLIGSAGTVNTGAIDDLTALAEMAKKYEMWFHVDGAYGGLAASVPKIQNLYKGIELADSVAVDFHKWLYQPFEAGCILVKDYATLKQAYYKKADYLDTSMVDDKGRVDFTEHYFQLSRSGKALKVWMSFKAFGAKKLTAMIKKDIDLARYIADLTEEAPDFRLKARSDLAVACFQYVGTMTDEKEISAFNAALIPALESDGRVFIMGTKLNGEYALRACLINHRKTEETCRYLLEVIREVAQRRLETGN